MSGEKAKRRPVRIGVTLGDINGIGPEVVLKALRELGRSVKASFALIGDAAILRQQASAFGLPAPPEGRLEDLGARNRVLIWDPEPEPRLEWRPGRVRADAGAAAAKWIRIGVQACLDGRLDGLVTAPISKEGFQRAGLPYPGHTEFLAELTKTRRYAMMLMGGALRVVLVTRHVPLSKVSSCLSTRAILDHIRLTGEALPWLGCPQARIGVCALNPHAGDGGVLGQEEKKIIVPAIRAAHRAGWNVTGPVPADVIFYQAVHGHYDAVVAMYHDQGLAPLKMLAFDTGVNVTLGLPIVRVSPDHGTAFDIAGQNRARASSMVAALRQAVALASRRNPWA